MAIVGAITSPYASTATSCLLHMAWANDHNGSNVTNLTRYCDVMHNACWFASARAAEMIQVASSNLNTPCRLPEDPLNRTQSRPSIHQKK